MWLATQAGKMEPSCPLGTTRCIPLEKFSRKPYNKCFIDQVCSVKVAGYWPRSVFAFLWISTSSWSINMQKKNLANIQPSWPHTWSITHTYFLVQINVSTRSKVLIHLVKIERIETKKQSYNCNCLFSYPYLVRSRCWTCTRRWELAQLGLKGNPTVGDRRGSRRFWEKRIQNSSTTLLQRVKKLKHFNWIQFSLAYQ